MLEATGKTARARTFQADTVHRELDVRGAAPRRTRRGRLVWAIVLIGIALFAAGWKGVTQFLEARAERNTRRFAVNYVAGGLLTGGHTGWSGFQMTIGESPIRIVELGRLKLNNNSLEHTLKLVDAETGAEISGGSTSINMSGKPAGQFVYGKLRNPVELKAGGKYLVVCSEKVVQNVGDYLHDYDTSLVTSDVAHIDSPVYWDANRWKPIGKEGQTFGPVDFRYRLP